MKHNRAKLHSPRVHFFYVCCWTGGPINARATNKILFVETFALRAADQSEVVGPKLSKAGLPWRPLATTFDGQSIREEIWTIVRAAQKVSCNCGCPLRMLLHLVKLAFWPSKAETFGIGADYCDCIGGATLGASCA